MPPKRREFLAKIIADMGKLMAAATVFKEIIDKRFDLTTISYGVVVSLFLFIVSYFLHPKE
ncbi:MAG: hypothetical protein AB1567_11115 [bacterium]